MLKPQSTKTRELINLDGLWDFKVDYKDEGFAQHWAGKRLDSKLQAPVPASYNDVFTDLSIRNHVGWVWYQRQVIVPKGWANDRVLVRVDSATHEGIVFVNGKEVARHVGGYMPFVADLTGVVAAGEEFNLTIAVNNMLTNETIPPGKIVEKSNGERVQDYQHDFYNYAGLARSIWLFSLPQVSIDDITVHTDFKDETGFVSYDVLTNLDSEIQVTLLDESNVVVASAIGQSSKLVIENVQLWQPGNAYLYRLKVEVKINGEIVDEYSLNVGVRTIRVDGQKFLINEKPFYFTGFGMHEDHLVIGKGHDNALMVHDFELLKWIGANSFRTSHYPYSEEVMDYADRHGIIVIDETAAVGINQLFAGAFGSPKPPTYGPDTANAKTQENLLQAVQELIQRDKNHPSVVMWSITNEPQSSVPEAAEFFKPAFELARQLDSTRPLTYINVHFDGFDKCLLAPMADVICINRYFGWYQDHADLASAEVNLEIELKNWTEKYQVPFLITEYGADTIQGAHSVHSLPWSEEYQTEFLEMSHRVFDKFPSIVGEHVWNFADFQTKPGVMRVLGNKKGVFSRDRQPKAAAHSLKARWQNLGKK